MEEIEEAIIKKLKENQPDRLSEVQIFDGIKGRKAIKTIALRGLLKRGVIGRAGKGKRGCPFLYFSPFIGEMESSPRDSTLESLDQDDHCMAGSSKPSSLEESEDELKNAVDIFQLLLRWKSKAG